MLKWWKFLSIKNIKETFSKIITKQTLNNEQKEAKEFLRHSIKTNTQSKAACTSPPHIHNDDRPVISWFSCQIQIKHWTGTIFVMLGLQLPHFSCQVCWLVHENLAVHVSMQLEALEATRKEYVRWSARRWRYANCHIIIYTSATYYGKWDKGHTKMNVRCGSSGGIDNYSNRLIIQWHSIEGRLPNAVWSLHT